ncbi:MAG: hypothetical protein H7X80_05535 [bacterium]|nr:hypothetical protein [Candidatus Kapabacteria bacterium]
MKIILPAIVLFVIASSTLLSQAPPPSEPVLIALCPFKNVTGEVKYDSLGWTFVDSLQIYLNSSELAGKEFTLVPMDDIRDQMLAQNVDVKSPSYEGDVWMVAEALGAKKIVWGTYIVKYEKANIETKVYDAKTVMPDPQHFAERIRLLYTEGLNAVTTVGDKILPAMHW